jgi:hypothetical protein
MLDTENYFDQNNTLFSLFTLAVQSVLGLLFKTQHQLWQLHYLTKVLFYLDFLELVTN